MWWLLHKTCRCVLCILEQTWAQSVVDAPEPGLVSEGSKADAGPPLAKASSRCSTADVRRAQNAEAFVVLAVPVT